VSAGPGDLERHDLDAFVRAEVGRLDPPHRATFLLHAHHGLTFPQVADVLGISESGAKQRYRRAREHLAKSLAHLLEEDER
jgi:DNA-directed RNA polymerase specialized sigma24 family protein